MRRFTVFSWFFISFIFLTSCSSTENKSTIAPEDTLKGRKVVAVYEDSLPAIVQFYKVDSGGNLTQELYREIRYYKDKKKYTDCSFVTLVEDSALHVVKDGPAFAYHENGNVQTEAFYVKGKEHGNYKVYREDGKVFYEGTYDMGERHGEWKFYYKNGNIGKKGMYTHGVCTGVWISYDLDGKEVEKLTASDTTIICGDCPKCKVLLQRKK